MNSRPEPLGDVSCDVIGMGRLRNARRTTHSIPVIAAFAWIMLMTFASPGYTQNTCSARCPNGSMSETYSCNSSYVPMCLRAGSSRAPAAGGAPAGPTPLQQLQLQGAQQLGTAIGNQLGQALFGSPQNQAEQQAQQQAQQTQQQRKLAAQQLNNSGIYLLKHGNYAGALNEFQQALAQTPDDPNIINNIALAKQQIRDTALAAKNSAALEKLLGKAPAKSSTFNFDQVTQPSSPVAPNSSTLNLVNLSSDASTVDLRGTKNTAVDAAALKAKLDSVLGNHASVPAPPNPRLQLPEGKDMELLGQPAQSARAQAVGMQRPSNDPKLVNPTQSEKQIKAEVDHQFDAIFAKPGGLDDILEKQATGANSK
ncbi:MAG TPA: tetratricopeptide repeat protein [Burkholderiaceae bacterium]